MHGLLCSNQLLSCGILRCEDNGAGEFEQQGITRGQGHQARVSFPGYGSLRNGHVHWAKLSGHRGKTRVRGQCVMKQG